MMRSALVRGLAFAALWFAFAEGDLSGGVVAVGSIVAATVASLWVSPASKGGERIKLGAIPRFALYFIRRSVAGGIDVARRALHPALPIAPRFLSYSLDPSGTRSTLFFVHVVSLLPGTLSCRLDGNVVRIHALDGRAPLAAELDRLRAEVERLFERR